MLRKPIFLLVVLLGLLCLGTSHAQVAGFSISPRSGCAPLSVNFSSQSSGAITTHAWDLGNSVTAGSQNPSTTYSAPGKYVVSLTVTGPGGSSTKIDTVEVLADPVVSFNAGPLAGCTPLGTQFNATVTPNAPGDLKYAWAFGDGTADTAANPLHYYATNGTFNVSLTVTNGAGCRTLAFQNSYVTAWPLPQLSFLANQSQHCGSPATVNFSSAVTNGSAPYTYSWDFGDQSTGTGASSSHTYTGGSYTVRAIVTDSRGCKDTERIPNYIFVLGTLPSFTAGNVCVDTLTSFVNTTGAGDTATWDFGDGSVDTGNFRWHKYVLPGTYTVRMNVRIGNCIKQASKQITVYPKANIQVTQSPKPACSAPQTLTFTASSQLPATYYWEWFAGGTATGSTVTKTYLTPTEDNVTVKALTANGCVSIYEETDVVVDDIYQLLTFINRLGDQQDTIKGGCAPYRIQFSEIKLRAQFPSASLVENRVYPATILSWHWDFGDGTTSTLAAPLHTYTTTGNFTIRTIIVTSNGCIDTQYTPIRIAPNITPFFTVSKDTFCHSDYITFFNQTVGPPGTLYEWTAPGMTQAPQGSPENSYVLNTINPVLVRLIATHSGGCKDSFVRPTPIVALGPFAFWRDSLECFPSRKVHYFSIADLADSLSWMFGDGYTDTAINPVHEFGSEGWYSPKMFAYNFTTGCMDSFMLVQPTPIVPPDIDFNAPLTKSCIGRPVAFMPVVPNALSDRRFGYPSVVDWISDGDTLPNRSSADPETKTYTNGGLHDVKMILRYGQSGRCYDSVVKSRYIGIPKPVVSFNADIVQGCNPLLVTFRDSTTNALTGFPGMQWKWSFGVRDSFYTDLTQDTIRYNYDSTGRFSIKLVVHDSLGCSDSLERPGYIAIHKTIARFDSASKGAGPDSACLYAPIQFRSASTGLTALKLHWDFGDGTTDTAIAPLHTYTTRGRYRVRLLATDSIGCSDSIVRSVPITITMPDAAFRLSSTVSACRNLPVTVSNSSTGATDYEWDFGDGNPGRIIVPNPVNTYLQAGVFVVRLVASDRTICRDTAFDTVRVLGYNGAFSFTPATGCDPLSVTFSPLVGGLPKLLWDFGDGFTDSSFNSASSTHIYTRSGTFLPRVIFSDSAGCRAPSVALDSVYVDKVTADFSTSVPCADTPFTLTSLSTALYGQPTRFIWSSPAATGTSNGSPGSLRIATAGSHPVTLIAINAAGCADTVIKNVVINALPPVSAGRDTAVCPGDTAYLYASGALRYTWAPSDRNPTAALSCSSCEVNQAWTRVPVVYTLSGVDANGCWGRDSVNVSIQLKTTSTTGPAGEICYGESYRLSADGADIYQWTPVESLDNPSIANPLATPRTTTTYMVVSQEGSCQVDTQRIQVVVNAKPDFSAGQDKIIALGSAATLEPSGNFTQIEWLNGDTSLSCWNCRNPNANPYFTRTYWARATNEAGCESIDSVTVHVRCNGSQIFIPNTFTPNGDGQNDWFFPQGEGLDRMATFRIFNRWGELIFEAQNVSLNSPSSGWDGTFRGQPLPPDTYVYTMTSRCRTGEIVNFKGDVTLVR